MKTEINECNSNPCDHSGTCLDYINEYICSCAQGFTGVSCETDIEECDSSPCENGATCNEAEVNLFTCNCAAEYMRNTCETDVKE